MNGHLQILSILESYFGRASYKSKSNQVTKGTYKCCPYWNIILEERHISQNQTRSQRESCKGKYLMVHGPHVVTMTCSLVYLGIRNIGDVLEGLEKEQKSRVYSDHKKVNKAGISLWMN
ncbi:uncharacterized protein LOC141689436 isoform X2 [Apium graveolens]|uniref:uncharacterized protein LOC141689436 isoform X2 n=1 Tax=Apium graveolens TaxID=4045 RepID=UPI003D7A62F7